MKKILPIISTLFLFSCNANNPNIKMDFPKDQNFERKEHAGNMFGNKDGIIIFEGKQTENKNEPSLWKKSIDIISSLFPITIANENTGLISTDWSNIKNISGNNDSYKLNLVITGKEFKKDNIKISVFKRTSSNKSEDISEKIINMIFTDAK